MNGNKKLTLNIIPVSFSATTLQIGRLTYTDENDYREQRLDHWQTHAFRFDSRSGDILNVSLVPGTAPLGQSEPVDLQQHLLLAAKAVQQSILIWVAGRRPVIRGGKRLLFWGQNEQSLLLTRSLRKVGLEPIPGLEVCLKYDIDCRLFWDTEEAPFLGLTIGVGTTNIMEVPVAELIDQGMSVTGRYVCRRKDFEHPYLQADLETIGQIYAIDGSRLLLTDSGNVTEIDAREVSLEPTLENLSDAINVFCKHRASHVLATLHDLRHPVATAGGKLDHIQTTLAGLRKRDIVIAPDIHVTFEDLLKEGNTLFPARVTTERPTLLFGPQGRNTGPFPDDGIRTWGPYMYMQHTRNAPLIGVVCESQNRGRIEQFMNSLCDGYPDELWRNQRKPNPFIGGLIGKFRLARIQLEFEECQDASPEAYNTAARRLLTRLIQTPDLVIVQIKDSFKHLQGDDNPYYVSKAAFMGAGVPTQSIRIELIEAAGPGMPYILNTVALASYAKLDGIPWVISTRGPATHELVVGIGSTEVAERRLGQRDRYVGITTMFQGDGRYLVWEQTREVAFEEYSAALLESLQTAIRYVEYQNGWQSGDKVRLVCHVYKRLKNCEVDAIKTLVRELVADNFQVEFAFLDISWEHPYYLFDPTQSGATYWSNGRQLMKGKGVPARGLCLQLDRWRALLHLTGPNDIKTDQQGVPQPLLVELHSESDFTDLTYLLRQIYHFTYMSWQSFMPATEPITIKYSRKLAQMMGNLRSVNGWDSKMLTMGNLRGRRWFL